MFGADGDHAALAGCQGQAVIAEVDGEVARPDDDRFRGRIVIAPAAGATTGNADQADVDAAEIGGFLGLTIPREPSECFGEISRFIHTGS